MIIKLRIKESVDGAMWPVRSLLLQPLGKIRRDCRSYLSHPFCGLGAYSDCRDRGHRALAKGSRGGLFLTKL